MSGPQAIFDQANFLHDQKNKTPKYIKAMSQFAEQDFQAGLSFLLCYQGSADTFKAYRREIERLMQWCIAQNPQKSLINLSREDLQLYLEFLKSPPKKWCGTAHRPRFLGKFQRDPNPMWRPFVSRTETFKLSNATLSATLAILSTFYTFLQQEQIALQNPVRMLRQKKRIIQSNQQTKRITRKLSNLQWQTVIECAQTDNSPQSERSLFILSILYLLSLRISEIAQNELHSPVMGDFIQDSHGDWWFKTIGKGNKYREVAVPDALLTALKRYRKSRNLAELPHKHETTPLIPRLKGDGSLGIRHIRTLVQNCFDQAIITLKSRGLLQEASDLSVATVHWLRHTAITADVQNRPIEHVRDDAGHNHASITDRYIDSDQRARHESARNKQLVQTKDINVKEGEF